MGGVDRTIRLEDYAPYLRDPGQAEPSEVGPDDFLRMYPTNTAAELAFDGVAKKMQAEPQWGPHWRQFIVVTGNKTVKFLRTVPGTSQTVQEERQVLTGYFRLNLGENTLPTKFVHWWVIGSGRSEMENLGVDLLVTDDGERDGVRGRHVQMYYPSSSLALMLKPSPGKWAFINGEKLENGTPCVLPHSCGLLIGNLYYKVQFTNHDEEAYFRRLKQILEASANWKSSRCSSFNPTPTESTTNRWGYQFQSPQAAGTYGVLHPCFHSGTGIVRAAKRIARQQKTFELVKNEISILNNLKEHGSHPHVCNIVEVFYTDGDKETMGGGTYNEVMVILEAYEPLTLQRFIISEPLGPTYTTLFHQGAQAVKFLHDCSTIHRDIKLDNFLVRIEPKPHLYLADFGHSMKADDSETSMEDRTDHTKGTISYLPPEILALKGASFHPEPWGNPGMWDFASDVFSYGLVGFKMFHQDHDKFWRVIDRESHKALTTALREADTVISDLLLQMLSSKPTDRITMRQVLLKNFWPDSATPFASLKRKLS